MVGKAAPKPSPDACGGWLRPARALARLLD
jgi:hypothetical protein